MKDLAQQPVALVKNYAVSELVLAKQSDIQAVYVDTILDGLEAISNHKALAMVSDLGSVSYKIRQYKMNNLEIAGLVDVGTEGLAMAVRKDWSILHGILDKALAAIPEERRQEILHHWIPVEYKPQLHLNAKEQQFLKEHPVIHIGVDPEFAPFEFIDEHGAYRGMASDYIRLLNKRLGVRFQVQTGLSWDEAVEQAKNKQLDVLPAVGLSTERKKYFLYSEPYIQFHRVIISQVGTPFLQGLSDIRQMKVAVQKNSSHEGFLKDYSDIKPITFATLQETLQAVADGQVDVMIGNIASSAYWIRKMNLTNLKVAAAASYDLQNLHFAVRNDWPELVSAIDKALASISPREHQRISNKWVSIPYDPVTDYTLFWKSLIIFIVVFLLLLLWLAYVQRQRRLLRIAKNEALAANKELKILQRSLEQQVIERTEALMLSERKFRQAQKMEALGTLVSGIVHDFNNMLTGMIGTVQLAQNTSDREEKEALLVSVCEQGFQASEMIKQLMSFAHHEAPEKSLILLNDLLATTQNIVRASVNKRVHIEFSICLKPLCIYANEIQIQQIIINLVNNAAAALQDVDDAHIMVRLKVFEADNIFMQHNSRLTTHMLACIEVEDNGMGIAAEDIEKIFDPFFTTKPAGEGTGLGLAMVYGTVHEHGGIIEVSSQLNRGSCFTVYLPLIEKEA